MESGAATLTGNLPSLVDTTLLPAGDGEAAVIREAHRWYEHLIALWAPGVIESASDLGFFAALAEAPLSSDELADASGTDRRATRVLLEALYAYGLVRAEVAADGTHRYLLPAEARECLLPDRLYSLVGKIGYDRRLAWDAWRNLADVVRRGSVDPAGHERQNQISEHDYTMLVRGINFWAPPVVDVLARALLDRSWAPDRSAAMLDVGCGTGVYSQLMLRRFPGLTAVGLDVPRIIPLARAQSQELEVGGRFTPAVFDFQTDEWDTGFDLILFANIFHLQTPDSAQELARRAAKAVADDGLVAIVDHIIRDDGTGVPSAQDRFFRLFAASMLATGGGDSYPIEAYDQWLANAGLRRVALLDTPMHRLLLAGHG